MSFFFLVKDEVDFPMGPIIYVCFSLESTNMNDISHGRCSWEGIWTPNICLKKTPSHDILGCLGPGRVETVWLFLLFLFFVQFFGKLRILKWTSGLLSAKEMSSSNHWFQWLYVAMLVAGYMWFQEKYFLWYMMYYGPTKMTPVSFSRPYQALCLFCDSIKNLPPRSPKDHKIES